MLRDERIGQIPGSRAAVVLFGMVYLAVGVGFPNPAAAGTTQFIWRLAAWLTSAAAFAVHIALEHFRLRNSPPTTALHVAFAVALGAFGLAGAANVHALSAGTGNRRWLALALVIWPIMTGVPAFVVALAAATGLGRLRPKNKPGRAALLLCVSACLWLGTIACHHPDSPLPLSGTLWSHLKEERFGTVTSIAGLSLGVADALRQLFRSPSLDIAEPGAEFQATSTAAHPTKLPSRRLLAAGCSNDHCLVYYECGGKVPTWRVALFHWGPDATRFEWGGAAPGGLVGIDDVRNAVLSRKITSPGRAW